MRPCAQEVRAYSNSKPRERRVLLFVCEGSSVKQFHTGRDVSRLISRVAEYRIRAENRQRGQDENYEDVENPANAPPRKAR
jgi:hypothetical protein